MRSISDIIMKDTAVKDSGALSDYLVKKEDDIDYGYLNTKVISLNILFSGRPFGGIPIGKMSSLSMPSQTGKSIIALILAAEAQKKGMEVIWIDSEYAFEWTVAEKFGIDVYNNFALLQEGNINQVKSIVAKIKDKYTRNERKNIFLVLDSWGGLISTKTEKDAAEGNFAADMSESKQLNSLAKIILSTNFTSFIINHVYSNVGGYGDPIKIYGGTKLAYLSHGTVLGRGKSKEKSTDKTELIGNIISAETFKSRRSKEGSKLEYRIKMNGALDTFYGLLDDALEAGVVISETKGKYKRPCVENDEEVKEKDIYNSAFWLPIFQKTNFSEYIENKYTFKNSQIDIIETGKEFFNKVVPENDNVEEEVSEKPKKSKKG